jgi:TolA-binding protein
LKTKLIVTWLVLASQVACQTSQDIAKGQEYVDPTEVKTVESTSSNSGENFDSLKQEIAVLKGQVEELQFSSSQEQTKLQARIRELETANQSLNADLAKAKIVATPVESKSPEGKSGAPLLWDIAQKDLQAGRFEQAQVSLQEIGKSYSKTKYALSAAVLLGLTQYKLKKFEDAALSFNQVIEKHAKEPVAALAWFGQASSFAQQKQEADAKLFFEELTRRYPKTSEAKLAARIAQKKDKVPADLFPYLSKYQKILNP